MSDKLIKLGNIVADYSKLTQDDLNTIADLFKLKNSNSNKFTQLPGQTVLINVEDLSHINPDFKFDVVKFVIYLQDWEVGHFTSYDDYIHTNWKAGDVMTYDWQNIQHCSANASHTPKRTLEITGIRTEQTNEFINRLKRFGTHQLALSENSWF